MLQDQCTLENLLSAGTVLLQLDSETRVDTPAHGSETWSALSGFLYAHGLQLASASQNVQRDLDFLVEHDFVHAAWTCAASQLHVRVYLIPFDLPGAHGCLRHRAKNEVLIPAKGHLLSLLRVTDRCAAAWANHGTNSSVAEPFIPPPSDARTLSEIFADVPSPQVDPSTFLSGVCPEIKSMYQDALRWDAPLGMRPLYPYQRRTVARMLQQELDPGVAIDPLYIPINGISDSKMFYLQPSTMELLREPPLRVQTKGGILCEEMGTGKTCMVLALIMASKNQLSSPEEAKWNAPERPVLTPLAFRHFPSPKFREARSAAGMEAPHEAHLPTLVQVLTHFIRANPERLGPPEFLPLLKEQDHLWGPLMRNVPFYDVYESISEASYHFRRAEQQRGPRKMYLTTATLVVVPRSIMAQWNAEINKHCDGGSLRVLELDNRNQARAIPSAQELASNYDLVLMTHERFSAERKHRDPKELYTWRLCSCDPEQPKAARMSCHTCHASRSVSPLVQIRWKRLVVDEGHVSATTSDLAVLARELNVERRWIVSGTPTRNLMGLSLGLSHKTSRSVQTSDDDEDDEDVMELSYPDDARNTEEDTEDSQMDVDERPHPRPWTIVDRNDLNRLGDMIMKFIGVPQFAFDNTFRKHVVTPLMDRGGPSFGAIQVLSQVMGHVMFRHQIHVVEQELPDKLPSLKEKTVTLMFQPLAAKTYNVLQSTIVVNAVDSERKDQDYLFHPNSRRSLGELLQNITQAMFWKTDMQLFDIEASICRAEAALNTAIARGRPDYEIQLLKEAIRVQTDAANDPLWRDVMHHEDNLFVIRGLSPQLQDAWLKLGASPRANGVSLLDPNRITKLRNILINSPLIDEHRLIERGIDVAEEEKKDAIIYEKYIRCRKRKRGHDHVTPTNTKLRKENSKAGSEEMLQEIKRELGAAIDRRERGVVRGMPSSARLLSAHAGLASRSPFATLTIGNSLSSKVDYILRKVLKHAAKDKFLIFSAFPLSLAYLAEALDVVQVPYLQYNSGVKTRVRQQMVVTYETSDTYRVLLMELKLGARGLNLVTASRIIFCEPVWHGDVESQAIKRAHRIGQKKDQIKVATLVMQGTSEEAMVTRRHVLKRKSTRWEEDVGMRRFVENPTFIGLENVEPHAFDVPGLDIPLVPRPEDPVDPAPGESIYAMAEEDQGRAVKARVKFGPLCAPDDTLPSKKIKMVHSS